MTDLAALGKKYLSQLRHEVLRLGLLCEDTMDGELFRGMTEKLSEEELLSMKKSMEMRLSGRYPPSVQLRYGEICERKEDCGDFVI